MIAVTGALTMIACAGSWVIRARAAGNGQRYALFSTVCAALACLCVVMWWIRHTEPAVSRTEVLKAGGLAAGSVIGLYALWLNDRRRKTEEGRREIENDRKVLEAKKLDQEVRRVSNEQFTRTVELLGHEAAQVRVGAMHALASQAAEEPARAQTILDVLCAYLRRPFSCATFRAYESAPEDMPESDPAGFPISAGDPPSSDVYEEYRERQVRRTAQRPVGQILRQAPKETSFDLDLTAAALESLSIQKSVLGQLVLRQARSTATWISPTCQPTGSCSRKRDSPTGNSESRTRASPKPWISGSSTSPCW